MYCVLCVWLEASSKRQLGVEHTLRVVTSVCYVVPQFLNKHRYGIYVSKYLLCWDDREVVGGDEWTTVKCSASGQTDRGF